MNVHEPVFLSRAPAIGGESESYILCTICAKCYYGALYVATAQRFNLFRGYLSLAGQDRRHPAEHGEHGVTQPALQDEGAEADEGNQQWLDRLREKVKRPTEQNIW